MHKIVRIIAEFYYVRKCEKQHYISTRSSRNASQSKIDVIPHYDLLGRGPMGHRETVNIHTVNMKQVSFGIFNCNWG